MTNVIRWEEPPVAKGQGAVGQRQSQYTGVADQLRAHPGRWALVCEKQGRGGGLASHIRMGQMQCFAPGGDFDAVQRTVDGVTRVYARYVGDLEAAA